MPKTPAASHCENQMNSKQSVPTKDMDRRATSVDHSKNTSRKKKSSKDTSSPKADSFQSAEAQQGVLGYMSHHRWGKEALKPVTLQSLTPRRREWVVALSPVLDMFDYDCQDILSLVETCEYDDARIQAAVDSIFKEQGGHERGQWQVGRRRGITGTQKNRSNSTPQGPNKTPNGQRKAALEKKKNGIPNNNTNHSRKSHNRHYAPDGQQGTGQTIHKVTGGATDCPTGHSSTAAYNAKDVASCSIPETSKIAKGGMDSSRDAPCDKRNEAEKEVSCKTSWASIVVSKPASCKTKRPSITTQERTEVFNQMSSKPQDASNSGDGKDIHGTQQKMSNSFTHNAIPCDEKHYAATEAYHNFSEKQRPSELSSTAVDVSILENEGLMCDMRRTAAKDQETTGVLKESQDGVISTVDTSAFPSGCLRKEAPPGLSTSEPHERDSMSKDAGDPFTTATAYDQKEPSSNVKLPRGETVVLKEGLDFYLGAGRRPALYAPVTDKPVGIKDRMGEVSMSTQPERQDGAGLPFDSLRYYQEDPLYGQRHMQYANQAPQHHMSIKEASMLRNGVPRTGQQALLYARATSNNGGYPRENNQRMVDQAFEVRPIQEVYESASMYHPMHPSYPTPFHVQQHRTTGMNPMSRYPFQYHAYNNTVSRPADFYPCHMDGSMLENHPPHYQVDAKQPNISVLPYRYNNNPATYVDLRPPYPKAPAGETGLPQMDSIPSDMQQLPYDGYRQACLRQGVSIYTDTVGVPPTVGYTSNSTAQPCAALNPPPSSSHDLGVTQETLKWSNVRTQDGTMFDPSLAQPRHSGFHAEEHYNQRLISYDNPTLCYEPQTSVMVAASTTANQSVSESMKLPVAGNDYLRGCIAPQHYVTAPNCFINHGSGMLRDHPPCMTREHPSSIIREHPGTMAREHPGTIAREHPGTMAREHPGTMTREHPGSTVREHPSTMVREHLGSMVREHPGTITRDLPGTITRDLPGAMTRDLPGAMTRDLPGTMTRDLPGAMTRDLPGAMTRDLPGAMTKDLPGAMTRDLPGAITRELPGAMTRDLPGAMTRDLPGAMTRDLPGAMTRDLPGGMTRDLPGAMTRDLPGAMTRDLPGAMTKDLPGAMTRDLPGAITRELPGAMTRDLPGAMTRNLPGAMTRDLPSTMGREAVPSMSRKHPVSMNRDHGASVVGDHVPSMTRDYSSSIARDNVSGMQHGAPLMESHLAGVGQVFEAVQHKGHPIYRTPQSTAYGAYHETTSVLNAATSNSAQ